jgi:hypothetical protein
MSHGLVLYVSVLIGREDKQMLISLCSVYIINIKKPQQKSSQQGEYVHKLLSYFSFSAV